MPQGRGLEERGLGMTSLPEYTYWDTIFFADQDTKKNLIHACAGVTSLEFSGNTQSRQCWHFCTTSNVNKLETVKDLVHFKVNLHLSRCYKF